MSPFRLSIAGLAVAAALGLAACGDDDDASDSGSTATTEQEAAAPTAPSSASMKVSETEFKISPANPSIDKAGTVTFAVSNDGKIPHALEVEGPDGETETGTIEPGKSEDLKVDLSKAGTYEWYCPIGNHKDQGMKGQIKVAGGGSGKAAEDDDEDKDDDKGSTGY